MKNHDLKNRSASYIQSIGTYSKGIHQKGAKVLQETKIIRIQYVNKFKHTRTFLVICWYELFSKIYI